ncbi:unnamed protein product [Pleuronectes platessa]|uniref:Transcription factor HIVEP3-like n=1 Tax=Pleuronectes platessa TaxID=8262 RepID=A0A9N7VVL7_PLEPL|nr:unnamed protein product [Pleuronectes platessa]
METLQSRLTTGEQSGGLEHCQPESPHLDLQPKSPSQPKQQTSSQKPHGMQQQPKQSRRQHPGRKRLRHQRQSTNSDTVPEHKNEATTERKGTTLPCDKLAVDPTQSKAESQESTPKQKRERKPQRPGKYVCTYCGRACAKPSVLQKHIRSHTGERPYPCAPCGFSFKTKSNLYKHRKSHTHRVKAGLALGEPRNLEEQVTESEDETRQLSSTSSLTERKSSVTLMKSHETDKAKDCTVGSDDSNAVKKRLALRLSRGKNTPQDSSDEKNSSLILSSKGSTESGYFSRSESTEQAQDSPPNTSAKSYAEIILGKYGRLGHLQRMSRPHNQQPSDQKEKSIPFIVPKKQVIDHITKLITINEAVVDTSKIDSVKPRRFSLSRKNSSENQKASSIKEQFIHSPKAGDPCYKSSGSITMGVPCQKFHLQSSEQPPGQTSTAPLVRSHSMPSAASSFDTSSGGSSKFRQSQSFDERQPSEIRAARRYGMLRRQPAIEIPLGAELTTEDHEGSHSFYPDSITTTPDHKPSQPQPYECEACGTGCKDWEGYKKHKQSLCLAHHPRNEVVISQVAFSQLINHAVRVGSSTVRKRRKEESLELDDPSSPSLPSPALLSGQFKDDSSVAYEGPRRPTLQTCSVIQHTSSFEKQESLCNENQGPEVTKDSPPDEECQLPPQKQPQQQSTKLSTRKLVRQHSVQVPEILVTEDSKMSTVTSVESAPTAKPPEKPAEFQWPQRSSSLAQLPIEKLPPKKKRLRLAEVAQSSGESSFDSISLPRSPSQESSASYASSRSTSFEESNRPDMETAASSPLRRSRASHMLTVPGVHQQRELRRSASEQAPHHPQPSILLAETRSKSFDYSCLSPERTAVGWRERRKCLLMRHTAIRDPDEEEEDQCNIPSRSPKCVTSSTSAQANPTSLCSSRPPTSPVSEGTSHIHTGQPPSQAPQPSLTHGPSGAARARYLPMSTGLKLEIPSQHDDYLDTRSTALRPQKTVDAVSHHAVWSSPLSHSSSRNGYNPNPPGLSSKTALSLLHCKQRLSPSIYTISTMSVRTTESMEQEDNKRPCSTEVYNSQSYGRDHVGTGNGQLSAGGIRSNRDEVNEEQKKKVEEVQSCSRNKEPPEVWISEEGSNEKYAPMRGGVGGKCQCEDCGFPLKNASVLQKCTKSHRCNCSECHIAFKAKGNLTEHLRSKPCGKETCCYTDDKVKGVCEDCPLHPEKQKDPSDLGKVGHDEDNNAKDKDGRLEDNWSKSSESQSIEPEPSPSILLPPKDSAQRSSARARRGLFARRCLDSSVSVSSRGSCSPSTPSLTPRREPSPPRSPSPMPYPSSSLSPSSCLVSTSPLSPVSPVRGLSPVMVQPHRTYSCGPLGSLANISIQHQTSLHPWDRPSTARLSVDEVGLTHIGPHPPRLQGAYNLLSHLPLHSQQPSRVPSLLIPIGGIHMIQPRSPLPHYRLVCSPTATRANPTGTGSSWRQSGAVKGRFSLLQRQDTLQKTSPDSGASPADTVESGEMPRSSHLDSLSHRKSQGYVQKLSSPSTEVRPAEVNTDAHVTERCVYPETTQGQKKDSFLPDTGVIGGRV